MRVKAPWGLRRSSLGYGKDVSQPRSAFAFVQWLSRRRHVDTLSDRQVYHVLLMSSPNHGSIQIGLLEPISDFFMLRQPARAAPCTLLHKLMENRRLRFRRTEAHTRSELRSCVKIEVAVMYVKQQRTRALTHSNTHRHTDTHRHTHTYTHTQTHTHTRARARALTYARAWRTHAHARTHTRYTHTHTHTQARARARVHGYRLATRESISWSEWGIQSAMLKSSAALSQTTRKEGKVCLYGWNNLVMQRRLGLQTLKLPSTEAKWIQSISQYFMSVHIEVILDKNKNI